MTDNRRVLIRGHVFPYSEKEPFVSSGVSILGAIEYDFQRDMVRCHECGEWFVHLGMHISAHELTGREYKLKHGLRLQTALASLETSARLRVDAKKQFQDVLGGRIAEYRRKPKPASAKKTGTWRPVHEFNNEGNRCNAQICFKVINLAGQLRRVPTLIELRNLAGLQHRAIMRATGQKTLAAAMDYLGLNANA